MIATTTMIAIKMMIPIFIGSMANLLVRCVPNHVL